ncbi:type IV secretion system protein [Aggregatibacter actinomycetemcomitans]|uniref:type IV secretion system protein n=1 Tax=Aggregatibacter actinomycetemcomitans TaxID=714 RepID=UPI001E4C41FB|nr:type IV secretion system protein [Aggregatibacter actinomycetemcomitans]
MRFFESIDSFVIQLLDSVSQSMSSNFASSLFTIIGVTLTIYFLGKGFAVISGKIEAPATALIYDFATKMIIVAFMMNYGGYLDNSLAIIDDLKTSLTGFTGNGIAGLMDDQLELGSDIAGQLFDLDKSKYVPLEGGIASFLAWIGVAVSLFVPFIIFITTTITLKLLTVTAPIFIFCLLYNFLRNTFNQWLQLILANILTVVFIGISLRMGMSFFGKNISGLITQAKEFNLILIGFYVLLFGLFMGYLAYLSLNYASQLASVSVEGVAYSAGLRGIGGIFSGAKNSVQNAARFGMGASGAGYSRAPTAYKVGSAIHRTARAVANAVRNRANKS